MKTTQLIEIDIKRCSKGLMFSNIRVHPFIEDMLSGNRTTEKLATSQWGRHWISIGSEPLLAWVLPTGSTATLGNPQGPPENPYRLDLIGSPILIAGSAILGGVSTINMSFLRLVGASQGASFIALGVFSGDDIETIGARIKSAATHFASMWMKPIELSIAISMRETVLP